MAINVRVNDARRIHNRGANWPRSAKARTRLASLNLYELLYRGSRQARELYKRLMDVQRTSPEAREPAFLGGKALQLEAARRHAVPIRLNFVARA